MENKELSFDKINKTRSGFIRYGEPKHLLDIFKKYPGTNTNNKASIVFKETRYNIILCEENGISYAILVETKESDSSLRNDSSFYEVKWTDESDSKLCIGNLLQLVKAFIYSEKNRFALVGGGV